MKNLQTLFVSQLCDMLDAEKRITKALPKLAKAATHDELREAFVAHLEETEGHVKKVEAVFASIGEKAKAKTCEATVGLLKEGEEMLVENKGTPAVNAALIAAAQKVEHYVIATYGSLREWAKLLGHDEAAEILDEILHEEKAANKKLNDLATQRCNRAAKDEQEEPALHHGA